LPTVNLVIGSYTFALTPKNSLNFDLSRSIFKLDTAGNPTYQDMGVNEKKLTFSGSIIGSDAWTQAETLESLMDQGLPQTLGYGPIQRKIRINSLNPKFIRFDRVDYDMDITIIPPKSGYNAPQQPTSTVTLPSRASPAATSTKSIAQYMDKTYKVKQGDTLWGIAQRLLGDGSKWTIIAKANGITNPKSLQIGQVIKYPSTTTNLTNASTAYANRQTATVTAAGISYLQSKENAVRFNGGAA
jgi:LysM repeat protein